MSTAESRFKFLQYCIFSSILNNSVKILILFLFLFILATTSFGGGLTWKFVKYDIKRKYSTVPQMTVQELASTNTTDFLIIDVRKKKEYEISHLKNAVNIETAKEILALANKIKKKERILYCSVGYRSSDIANQLLAHNVTNIYNLEGSIFEWVNSGRTVYNKNGITNKVHPYNKAWGILLKAKYHK